MLKYKQMIIYMNILQLPYELDELRIELQRKKRCSVRLVPELDYIQIKLTDYLYCVILCLLCDSLVKLNLVVTSNVIYKIKEHKINIFNIIIKYYILYYYIYYRSI